MEKKRRVFWHFLVWAGLISFAMFMMRNVFKLSMHHVLIEYLLYGIVNISLFYLNYLVLIPQYLNRKRYGLYLAAILSAIVMYGFIKYGIALFFKDDQFFRPRRRDGPPMGMQEMNFIGYFVSTVFTSIIFIFFSVVLKLFVDWFVNERVQRDLENQRLSAELSFLKSQINPHFLFNSLNSIYSLAYQRSDTTPDAILKLSEIMRYMLYECNDNTVDLSKELHYLQNFIDLQKIRLGDKAYVDFKIEGKVTNQKIAPLLLIAFIENAFKHGVASDASSPIQLYVSILANQLQFYVHNKKHKNNTDAVGGIGLNNVKRRLDLLYPGKYNLDIHDEKDTYTCELSLVL
ncbi:MAG: sensor histidine kinase [Mucilaginibacter sp.]